MQKLNIKRTFDAPIEKVWDAFTKAELLKKWWSPENMECSYMSVDLQKNGSFHFCFKGEDKKEFWGLGTYKNIQKPNNMSYLDTFSDSKGKPVPPSYYAMPGDKIIASLVEIDLSKKDTKTNMSITMDNYYDNNMTADLTKGWNSMFDKLNSLLTK